MATLVCCAVPDVPSLSLGDTARPRCRAPTASTVAAWAWVVAVLRVLGLTGRLRQPGHCRASWAPCSPATAGFESEKAIGGGGEKLWLGLGGGAVSGHRPQKGEIFRADLTHTHARATKRHQWRLRQTSREEKRGREITARRRRKEKNGKRLQVKKRA